MKLFLRIAAAFLAFSIGVSATSLRTLLRNRRLLGVQASSPAVSSSEASVQIPESDVDSNERSWAYEQGEYSNIEYAYSVKIPEGLIAYHSPPPMPQHGFGIDLFKEDGVELWVDGSYNSLEWTSLSKAADTEYKWVRQDHAETVKVKRSFSYLSSLRAIRVVWTYKAPGRDMVLDEIVAIRKAREIVYTLQLRTTTDRYAEDVKILNSLQQTFRLKALPEP